MASEHDILARLPEAPAPAPEARQAAIANALERFEKNNATRFQGNEHDLRLMQQTAASNSPSRRRALMPRARQLVAASLVALMAGSATWFYVNETSVVPTHRQDHLRNVKQGHRRQDRSDAIERQPAAAGRPSPLPQTPPSRADWAGPRRSRQRRRKQVLQVKVMRPLHRLRRPMIARGPGGR